jgi:hypothetical protein
MTGAAPRGDIGKEPVEPPGDAPPVGTGRLHRVTYGGEPALQPDPVAASKVSGTEKALRDEQPAGHPIGQPVTPEWRHLESPNKAAPCPHIPPVNINGQQNRRVGIDHRL